MVQRSPFLTAESLRPASLPDQGIDPLPRIIGGDMRPASFDDAAIFGLIAAEHRDPLRQRVGIVGDERLQLGRQAEAFGSDRRHDAGDTGRHALENLALETRAIASGAIVSRIRDNTLSSEGT